MIIAVSRFLRECSDAGKVTDHAKSIMSSMRESEFIDMDQCDLGPIAMKFLSEALVDFTKLKKVCFSHNPLCDPGIGHLSVCIPNFEYLTEIDLTNTCMGVEGGLMFSRSIKGLKCISSMSIGENNIGGFAMQHILSSIKHPHRMVKLRISKNSIGDANMKCISVSLSRMTLLAHLDVSYNDFGDQGMAEFSEALRCMNRLQRLDMKGDIQGKWACVLHDVLYYKMHMRLWTWSWAFDEDLSKASRLNKECAKTVYIFTRREHVSVPMAFIERIVSHMFCIYRPG